MSNRLPPSFCAKAGSTSVHPASREAWGGLDARPNAVDGKGELSFAAVRRKRKPKGDMRRWALFPWRLFRKGEGPVMRLFLTRIGVYTASPVPFLMLIGYAALWYIIPDWASRM
jgi:hypothetical protein